MSPRQLKSFIAWAKTQGILALEIEGVKVTFNPAMSDPIYAQSHIDSVIEALKPKTKDELIKEEDELLYASAL